MYPDMVVLPWIDNMVVKRKSFELLQFFSQLLASPLIAG